MKKNQLLLKKHIKLENKYITNFKKNKSPIDYAKGHKESEIIAIINGRNTKHKSLKSQKTKNYLTSVYNQAYKYGKKKYS